MKVRSTIVLILWIASLGEPLLSLQANECKEACCVMTETTCPMESHEEGCPSMKVGTPINPVPAVPVQKPNTTVSLAQSVTTQIIPFNLQLTHSTLEEYSYHLLLIPLSSPLII